MTDPASLGEPRKLRDVLPELQGKEWFITPLHRVDADLERVMARGDATGQLTEMTARDPRGVGVRGAYPQINEGLPRQDRALVQFVRFAYRRSAVARLLVDKIASDVWGEWVDVQTDNEGLKLALEAFFRNPTGQPGERPLPWWIERAYRLARRDGRSLLYFGLEDGNALNPRLPPVNVRGCSGLAIIRQENIQEVIRGTDPKNPREYNRVQGYRITLNQGGGLGLAGDSIIVHASRVQPFIPYPDEEDEDNGSSILAQNINYVEMVENVLWAVVEAYFQEAAPYVIVVLDKDVKLNSDEMASAKAEIAKMQQSLTQRIFLKGVKVEVLQGSGQLANPMPHWEVTLQMLSMSMGGVAMSQLVGTQAGRTQGAEEDTRRYQSLISKIQEQDADPALYSIGAKLVEWDVQRWAATTKFPVVFSWRPVIEAAPGAEATRQKELMEARTGYRAARLPLPEELDYEVTEWPQGTEDYPPPAPAFQGGKPPVQGDAESVAAALEQRLTRRLMDALKPRFKAAASAARTLNPDLAGDDTSRDAEFIINNPTTRDALAQALLQGYADSLQAGGHATLKQLDADALYDATQSRYNAEFKSLAKNLAGDVAARLAENVRRVVAEGLAQGLGATALSSSIMDAYEATRVDALRIARTESVRAFNRGSADAMQQAGIGQFQFVAFPDCCPKCSEHDGQVYPAGDDAHIPPLHPNDRCSIVPYLGDE